MQLVFRLVEGQTPHDLDVLVGELIDVHVGADVHPVDGVVGPWILPRPLRHPLIVHVG